MTTTLNLPDDLASAVQRRAAEEGRDVAAEVVELVRKGLAATEHAAAGALPVPKHLPLIKARPTQSHVAQPPTPQQMCDFIKELEQQDDLERLERAFGHQYVDRSNS